jgi:hypothetical protein
MLNDRERAQASAIRAQAQQAMDRYGLDPTLSAHGKQVHRARVHLQAQAQLRALRAAAERRQEQATSDAYHRAFRIRSDSDRALRAEVASLGPGEAARALELAKLRGDTAMMTALGELAYNQTGQTDLGDHWETLLGAYTKDSPDRDRAIGDLVALKDSKAAKLNDNLLLNLSPPSDLRSGDLAALAAEADAPAGGAA